MLNHSALQTLPLLLHQGAARGLFERAWAKSQESTHHLSPGCCNPEIAKKGSFTQPTFTGLGSAQEKRPTCLKIHGSPHRKKGAGAEKQLYFAFKLPGWVLEGPSNTLWWPELSGTARSCWEEGVGLCKAFAITGINHSKLWQSPGGVWGHGKVMDEEKKEKHCKAPRRWVKVTFCA